MSTDDIKRLLVELREEIEKIALDNDTRQTLQELDTSIGNLLESGLPKHGGVAVRDRALQAEARLASEHPVIERMIREIMDMLAKIGV